MLLLHKEEVAELVQALNDAQGLLHDAYLRESIMPDTEHAKRWLLVRQWRERYWPHELGRIT